MDRTSCITGCAVGSALAGALAALSCRASSPAAVTEPSHEARSRAVASAGPSAKVDGTAAVKSAVVRGGAVGPNPTSIVLPMAYIYARPPHRVASLSADAMPMPRLAPWAVSHVYGVDDARFDSSTGWRSRSPRWSPGSIPAGAPPRSRRIPWRSQAPAPALDGETGAPPPLPVHFDGDPKLPVHVARAVLRSHRGAFDVCYATAAHVDPGLHGLADVDFLVGKSGRVGYVETHGEGLQASSVPRCVSNVVSRLTFAPPARPIEMRLRFDVRAPLRSTGAIHPLPPRRRRDKSPSMCRVLAYLGEPILLEDLLYKPDVSFVNQTHRAALLHRLNLAGLRPPRLGRAVRGAGAALRPPHDAARHLRPEPPRPRPQGEGDLPARAPARA